MVLCVCFVWFVCMYVCLFVVFVFGVVVVFATCLCICHFEGCFVFVVCCALLPFVWFVVIGWLVGPLYLALSIWVFVFGPLWFVVFVFVFAFAFAFALVFALFVGWVFVWYLCFCWLFSGPLPFSPSAFWLLPVAHPIMASGGGGGDDRVVVFVFCMLRVDLTLSFVGPLFAFVLHVVGDCIWMLAFGFGIWALGFSVVDCVCVVGGCVFCMIVCAVCLFCVFVCAVLCV